jgi:hypothetical protein
MRENWAGRAVGRVVKMLMFGVLFFFVFVPLFGYVVMRLWNWLMPGLFGWHVIGFWQALGLLILCKILFGGFRGGSGRHGHWRGRMRERWGRMTPEEREKFRESMRGRHCGPFGPPAAEPKA